MTGNIYTTEKIGERTYRIDEGGRDNCYLLLGNEKALLIDSSIGTGKEVFFLSFFAFSYLISDNIKFSTVKP